MILLPLALLWLAGFAILWRIPLCRADEAGRRSYPSISVIIPARNEEANIPGLLESLRGQNPSPIEILVVDDCSGDSTASVAKESGARVLESAPLPRGWTGKTWACHQGAEAAAGKLLVFMDADTRLAPGGLRRIVDTFLGTPGALSITPFHFTERPYEELSAFFNLMVTTGIGAFTILGERAEPAGLFGQFLMIDKDDYRRAGGHEKVRGRILENFFMAANLRKAGVPLVCRGGRGTLGVRMYPSGPGELVSGWSKAFLSGAAGVPRPLLALTVAWITGEVLAFAIPILAAIAHPEALLPGLALYMLHSVQTGLMLRRIGSFRPFTWLFYPIPLLFFFALMAAAFTGRMLGRTVSWKGRTIRAGDGRDQPDAL